METKGIETKGFAVPAANAPLEPWTFTRRELRDGDVALDILFGG